MAGLDKIIHEPVRLRIMAALAALETGQQLEFTTLRDLLKVTDGNLGAHLGKLEEAGYVQVEKMFVERKPRTFVSASGRGRDTFGEHIKELKNIISGAEVDEHLTSRRELQKMTSKQERSKP